MKTTVNQTQVNYFIEKFICKMNNSMPSTSAWWIDGINELTNIEKQLVWVAIQKYIDHTERDRQLEHGDMPKWYIR